MTNGIAVRSFSLIESERDSLLLVSFLEDGSGDFLVSIEAHVDGFSGHADGHVAGAEWLQFVADLQQLAQSRKGAARVRSADPEGFELSIHTIDSLGHVATSGTLRFRRPGAEWPQQELAFGFAFDPSRLETVIKVLHDNPVT